MSLTRRVLVAAIAVAVFAAASGLASDLGSGEPYLSRAELLDRAFPLPISIVVEPGYVVPSLRLLELDRVRAVRIEITHGPAVFLYRPEAGSGIRDVRRVEYRSRSVRLPAISAGEPNSESLFEIAVDGDRIADPIRIAVLAEGSIEKLAGLDGMAGAILGISRSGRWAVVDPGRADLETAVEELREPEESGNLREDGFEWCPEDEWLEPRVSYSFPNNNCNVWVADGKVDWLLANPRQAGYSVKVGTSNHTLIWGEAPSQFPIDGIYRASWGCGIALKVPALCVATVRVVTGRCCCNGATALLGHVCKWVDTYALFSQGWPKCPLK